MGKTWRVGLTPTALAAIQDYFATRPAIECDRFLVNDKGQALDRFGVKNRLTRLGKNANVKASPHAIRRAFVTINANKGRPLPMLQIACGHSNITTTFSYCMTTEEEAIKSMKQ